MQESIKSKAADLSLHCGYQPGTVFAGLPEALKVWDAFVSRMPDSVSTPKAFRDKVLTNNPELVYAMIEAAGLRLNTELVRLKDLVSDLEGQLDEAYDDHVLSLATAAKHHKALLYQMLDVEIDEPDELPQWKVTVVYAGSVKEMGTYERHTCVIDHRDMARYFPRAEVVSYDPDPEYDGPVDVLNMDGDCSTSDEDDGELPEDDKTL